MDKGLTRGGYEYSDFEIHKQTSRETDPYLLLAGIIGEDQYCSSTTKPEHNSRPRRLEELCVNVSFITEGFDRKANTTRTAGYFEKKGQAAPTCLVRGVIRHIYITSVLQLSHSQVLVLWKYYGRKAFPVRDFAILRCRVSGALSFSYYMAGHRVVNRSVIWLPSAHHHNLDLELAGWVVAG